MIYWSTSYLVLIVIQNFEKHTISLKAVHFKPILQPRVSEAS